jgi:hypothetical protein
VSDMEIKELIRDISRMAARVGCVFVPDEKKIRAMVSLSLSSQLCQSQGE